MLDLQESLPGLSGIVKKEIWSSSNANRRTKERSISFVVERVSLWRKLYNGVPDG